MHIYDTNTQKYYRVTDKEAYLNYLEDIDFSELKQIFKMTYQEFLFQEGLRKLLLDGLINDLGYYMDVRSGCEMYREYIVNRYNESVYNKMIVNFKADYDYKARCAANPSMLN